MQRRNTNRQLFGTDGIRGVANVHPMTCEVALSLGRAVAHQARSGPHRHQIVIGKDTRQSCYMLEMAFASGVCSMGVDAVLVGPMPTPAVAFLTRSMRADAGVVISASHNAYQDNGIKLFARDGFKLPDAAEAELEALMTDRQIEAIRPTRGEVGMAFRMEDAAGRYIESIKASFPAQHTLEGLRVAIDCAHGASYKIAPAVLRELGAEVVAMGVAPNGRNINDGCGAVHPEPLALLVREQRCDVGIALDGDADRLVLVDAEGTIVDGDVLLAMNATDMLKRQSLRSATLVTTVMANLALDKCLHRHGGQVVRTQVGDRYVVETMREGHYSFGGENSGHLIYLDQGTTGDGMLAALQTLSILARSRTTLRELAAVLTPYPQSLINVPVRDRLPLESLPGVQGVIDRVNRSLGSDGRVMVRYSGTEAKARVLVEGPEAALVAQHANEIAGAIAKEIGA
jgi:phosphoglucosamine mutase